MKVAFYLKRPEAETETAIFARISYGAAKPLKYYTPEAITPKYWNKNTYRAKVQRGFPEAPEFNARIDKIETDIKNVTRKLLNMGSVPSNEDLRAALDAHFNKGASKSTNDGYLLPFFDKMIEQSKNGLRSNSHTGKPISPNTLKAYGTYRARFEAYETKRNKRIRFDAINQAFYDDFTAFLVQDLKLSNGTVIKQQNTLIMILNAATKAEVNTNLKYQHCSFATKNEATDTIYLTKAEIKSIADLDLTDSPRLDNVRDLFIIGCYTGLRFSDYASINAAEIKDDMQTITQRKTGNKVVIPIHDEVKRVLAKRGGVAPRPISNQKFNDYIKDVAAMVESLKVKVKQERTTAGKRVVTEIEKYKLIGSHSARRSFASNQYLNGVPTLMIMAITGHKTEKAFLHYIRVTPTEQAREMLKLWNNK